MTAAITLIAVTLVCLIGLAVTLQAGNKKSEKDEVSQQVKRHPLLFNPVIIIYSLAGVAGVAIILYYMMVY
ncbi:hypothetical protein KP77_16660 [Jeotgalibacillus alimentarius]|uniref:Uncharacterized protein n=1 Tax=Jeotgalibacillus alimentarius TaxID=135826 RepID=A0A0C2W0Y2_9BACL|nr:hypothetical protein [Jeotgalibacillus alimentarius]KIL50291.1 hypothetical protein KP77_16660 [Jeotgalibacillus alimentarius]